MAKRKTGLSDRQVLTEAEQLSLKVRKLLAGHDHDVQGSVLVDLVSMFVAGHAALKPGDPQKGPWSAETLRATRDIRAELLSAFVRTVDALVPVSAKQMGAPHDPIDPDPEHYATVVFRQH